MYIDKLQRVIDRIHAAIPQEEDVLSAMRNQAGRIRTRTLAGRDVNGFPLLRKKDGSPSTLTRTGLLLRSLQATVSSGQQDLVGRIFIAGRAREYAPFVNAKRRFLGASSGERAGILADLKKSSSDRRRR